MRKSSVVSFFVLGFIFVFINLKISDHFYPKGFSWAINTSSDAEGYYQYLPNFFINDNILHQPYGAQLENGCRLDKYTCGVALLEAPFFFLAHTVTIINHHKSKGFDNIYGYFVVIAACVYMYIALFVLFRIITRRFGEFIALISVVSIYLGTNLFYYTINEAGLSHTYSFFCFVMFIYFVGKYYEQKNLKNIIGLSIFLAIATLIRPTNILLLLLFLFYEIYTIQDFKQCVVFHLKHYYNFIIILIVGLIVFSPQIAYWYALTGKFIFYSYQNETFSNWNSPKIIEVLVGHKSGWLLYSPIMVFSLIGLVIAIKNKMLSAPAIFIIFIVILYVCASWWAYTFGCAFGYRSFSEYSAILIFPMALFFHKVFWSKKTLFKLLLFVALIVCIYYNLKLTRLYYLSGGCWDGPNWYWSDYIEKLKLVLK